MVYVKEDGSYGFSWKEHYDYLLREHSDDLEDIAHTKLELLMEEEPQKAKYYEALDTELRRVLGNAWDKNPKFGYKDSDEVVKAFIKEKGLGDLFDDIPALSDDEIENVDLDFDDDIPELTEIS